MRISSPLNGRTFNAVDCAVSQAVRQYGTNFAWTGSNVTSRAYLEFRDAGPVARDGLRRPFPDPYIEQVKQLMGK